jgi:hypothetical protein
MRDQPQEFPKFEMSPIYYINAKPTHERIMAVLASETGSRVAPVAPESPG